MPWDPMLYERFKYERSLPFFDLAAMIVNHNARSVLDLGCGSGELTATLLDSLPYANILGLDSSPEMLAAAKSRSSDRLRFELGDQAKISGKYDLILSNASIQWSPDHPTLIPNLLDHLTDGGQLLIQMPSNHFSPVHLLIYEIARKKPFEEWLGGFNRQSPVLSTESYSKILNDANISRQSVLERVYPHILNSRSDVLNWISGTALLPYKERLSLDQFDIFTKALQLQLLEIFPTETVFYPFKRLFISAIKGI